MKNSIFQDRHSGNSWAKRYSLYTLNHSFLIEVICCLLSLLFLFSAFRKLIDYQIFKIEIGQFRLLYPIAGKIVSFFSIVEIIVSIMLFIPKFKKAGLFISFTLMILFTGYIICFLIFSKFIQPHYGELFDGLSPLQHIVLNAIILFLNLFAILLLNNPKDLK